MIIERRFSHSSRTYLIISITTTDLRPSCWYYLLLHGTTIIFHTGPLLLHEEEDAIINRRYCGTPPCLLGKYRHAVVT